MAERSREAAGGGRGRHQLAEEVERMIMMMTPKLFREQDEL